MNSQQQINSRLLQNTRDLESGCNPSTLSTLKANCNNPEFPDSFPNSGSTVIPSSNNKAGRLGRNFVSGRKERRFQSIHLGPTEDNNTTSSQVSKANSRSEEILLAVKSKDIQSKIKIGRKRQALTSSIPGNQQKRIVNETPKTHHSQERSIKVLRTASHIPDELLEGTLPGASQTIITSNKKFRKANEGSRISKKNDFLPITSSKSLPVEGKNIRDTGYMSFANANKVIPSSSRAANETPFTFPTSYPGKSLQLGKDFIIPKLTRSLPVTNRHQSPLSNFITEEKSETELIMSGNSKSSAVSKGKASKVQNKSRNLIQLVSLTKSLVAGSSVNSQLGSESISEPKLQQHPPHLHGKLTMSGESPLKRKPERISRNKVSSKNPVSTNNNTEKSSKKGKQPDEKIQKSQPKIVLPKKSKDFVSPSAQKVVKDSGNRKRKNDQKIVPEMSKVSKKTNKSLVGNQLENPGKGIYNLRELNEQHPQLPKSSFKAIVSMPHLDPKWIAKNMKVKSSEGLTSGNNPSTSSVHCGSSEAPKFKNHSSNNLNSWPELFNFSSSSDSEPEELLDIDSVPEKTTEKEIIRPKIQAVSSTSKDSSNNIVTRKIAPSSSKISETIKEAPSEKLSSRWDRSPVKVSAARRRRVLYLDDDEYKPKGSVLSEKRSYFLRNTNKSNSVIPLSKKNIKSAAKKQEVSSSCNVSSFDECLKAIRKTRREFYKCHNRIAKGLNRAFYKRVRREIEKRLKNQMNNDQAEEITPKNDISMANNTEPPLLEKEKNLAILKVKAIEAIEVGHNDTADNILIAALKAVGLPSTTVFNDLEDDTADNSFCGTTPPLSSPLNQSVEPVSGSNPEIVMLSPDGSISVIEIEVETSGGGDGDGMILSAEEETLNMQNQSLQILNFNGDGTFSLEGSEVLIASVPLQVECPPLIELENSIPIFSPILTSTETEFLNETQILDPETIASLDIGIKAMNTNPDTSSVANSYPDYPPANRNVFNDQSQESSSLEEISVSPAVAVGNKYLNSVTTDPKMKDVQVQTHVDAEGDSSSNSSVKIIFENIRRADHPTNRSGIPSNSSERITKNNNASGTRQLALGHSSRTSFVGLFSQDFRSKKTSKVCNCINGGIGIDAKEKSVCSVEKVENDTSNNNFKEDEAVTETNASTRQITVNSDQSFDKADNGSSNITSENVVERSLDANNSVGQAFKETLNSTLIPSDQQHTATEMNDFYDRTCETLNLSIPTSNGPTTTQASNATEALNINKEYGPQSSKLIPQVTLENESTKEIRPKITNQSTEVTDATHVEISEQRFQDQSEISADEDTIADSSKLDGDNVKKSTNFPEAFQNIAKQRLKKLIEWRKSNDVTNYVGNKVPPIRLLDSFKRTEITVNDDESMESEQNLNPSPEAVENSFHLLEAHKEDKPSENSANTSLLNVTVHEFLGTNNHNKAENQATFYAGEGVVSSSIVNKSTESPCPLVVDRIIKNINREKVDPEKNNSSKTEISFSGSGRRKLTVPIRINRESNISTRDHVDINEARVETQITIDQELQKVLGNSSSLDNSGFRYLKVSNNGNPQGDKNSKNDDTLVDVSSSKDTSIPLQKFYRPILPKNILQISPSSYDDVSSAPVQSEQILLSRKEPSSYIQTCNPFNEEEISMSSSSTDTEVHQVEGINKGPLHNLNPVNNNEIFPIIYPSELTIQEHRHLLRLKRCDICKIKYPFPKDASDCLLHHKFKKCWLCFKVYTKRKGALKKHTKECHPLRYKGKVKCVYCNDYLPLTIELRNHIESKHFQIDDEHLSNRSLAISNWQPDKNSIEQPPLTNSSQKTQETVDGLNLPEFFQAFPYKNNQPVNNHTNSDLSSLDSTTSTRPLINQKNYELMHIPENSQQISQRIFSNSTNIPHDLSPVSRSTAPLPQTNRNCEQLASQRLDQQILSNPERTISSSVIVENVHYMKNCSVTFQPAVRDVAVQDIGIPYGHSTQPQRIETHSSEPLNNNYLTFESQNASEIQNMLRRRVFDKEMHKNATTSTASGYDCRMSHLENPFAKGHNNCERQAGGRNNDQCTIVQSPYVLQPPIPPEPIMGANHTHHMHGYSSFNNATFNNPQGHLASSRFSNNKDFVHNEQRQPTYISNPHQLQVANDTTIRQMKTTNNAQFSTQHLEQQPMIPQTVHPSSFNYRSRQSVERFSPPAAVEIGRVLNPIFQRNQSNFQSSHLPHLPNEMNLLGIIVKLLNGEIIMDNLKRLVYSSLYLSNSTNNNNSLSSSNHIFHHLEGLQSSQCQLAIRGFYDRLNFIFCRWLKSLNQHDRYWVLSWVHPCTKKYLTELLEQLQRGLEILPSYYQHQHQINLMTQECLRAMDSWLKIGKSIMNLQSSQPPPHNSVK